MGRNGLYPGGVAGGVMGQYQNNQKQTHLSMKQVVFDSLYSPQGAAIAGAGSVGMQEVVNDGTTLGNIMQVITFVIGIIPAIKAIFRKKKTAEAK